MWLFRKKKYVYFVYFKAMLNNEKINGSCEITLSGKINSHSDILLSQQHLLEKLGQNNISNLLIINYQLLRTEN